jgi:hypothetical protein
VVNGYKKLQSYAILDEIKVLLADRVSITDIAPRYGVSITTIHNWIKYFGIRPDKPIDYKEYKKKQGRTYYSYLREAELRGQLTRPKLRTALHNFYKNKDHYLEPVKVAVSHSPRIVE